MAVRTFTVEDIDKGVIVTWTGLLNGDTGSPWPGAPFTDRSVHVTGTMGVGGTLKIEGTNDSGGAPAYAVLNDPASAALSFTSVSSGNLKQILENAYRFRPNVTAGDGTTSLTVKLCATHGSRG